MIIRVFKRVRMKSLFSKDPLYSCDVYKKEGCCHVDGILCDVNKCLILKEYVKEK